METNPLGLGSCKYSDLSRLLKVDTHYNFDEKSLKTRKAISLYCYIDMASCETYRYRPIFDNSRQVYYIPAVVICFNELHFCRAINVSQSMPIKHNPYLS